MARSRSSHAFACYLISGQPVDPALAPRIAAAYVLRVSRECFVGMFPTIVMIVLIFDIAAPVLFVHGSRVVLSARFVGAGMRI